MVPKEKCGTLPLPLMHRPLTKASKIEQKLLIFLVFSYFKTDTYATNTSTYFVNTLLQGYPL